MMKKHTTLLAFILTTLPLAALEPPAFSGFTGILGQASLDKEIYGQGFFAGQFDFSGKLLFRTEFYLETDNLIENSILETPEDNNSKFKIQELSATYKMNMMNTSHFLSIFLGNFEPTGSDIFLQRQFGLKSIASRMTESFHGLSGAAFSSFLGAGLAYTIRFNSPFATAVYLYKNRDSSSDQSALSGNLRLAGALSSFIFDISVGANCPVSHETSSGDKVLFMIDYAILNGGITAMIGSNYTSSLYLQAGISDFIVNPPKSDDSYSVDTDKIYLIFEPRLVFNGGRIHFTLFNIPDGCFNDMIYFVHAPKNDGLSTAGINMCLFTENLYLDSKAVTLGINTTFCFPGTGLGSLAGNIQDCDRALYLAPFIEIPSAAGKITAIVSADILEIPKAAKESFVLMLGYRTQL